MTSCRGSTAKFLLCLINSVFFMLSFGCILLGTRMNTNKESNEQVVLELCTWRSLAMFFIIFGAILCVITSFGFISAVCESPLLLNIYIYFITLCGISFVLLYIGVFYFSPIAVIELRAYYEKLMKRYFDSSDAMFAIQKFQSAMFCCGMNSYKDWLNSSFVNMSINGLLPSSCCGESVKLDLNETSKMCDKQNVLYFDGCFSSPQIDRYRILIHLCLILLIISMMFILTLACCLERDQLLQTSRIVNLQYSAHLNSCRPQKYFPSSQMDYQRVMAANSQMYLNNNSTKRMPQASTITQPTGVPPVPYGSMLAAGSQPSVRPDISRIDQQQPSQSSKVKQHMRYI